MVSQCQTIKKLWAGEESAQTDGQTVGQTDRQTDSYIPPLNFVPGGYNKHFILHNLCNIFLFLDNTIEIAFKNLIWTTDLLNTLIIWAVSNFEQNCYQTSIHMDIWISIQLNYHYSNSVFVLGNESLHLNKIQAPYSTDTLSQDRISILL